jgi:hypothetical protein
LGPTNPVSRGSGEETDPTAGMEAGGGAEERWRGGYGGARPGPEPGGCHPKPLQARRPPRLIDDATLVFYDVL